VRGSFKPNSVPVWIDEGQLKAQVEKLLKDVDRRAKASEERTIVWTSHRATGQKMHEMGIPYYGARGEHTTTREPIETADERVIAACVQSNGTGRNLQAYANNLLLQPIGRADLLEQLIGRTHRMGQTADEVTFTCITCPYTAHTWARAKAQAAYQTSLMDMEHKMTMGREGLDFLPDEGEVEA
jgi:hypothetical protein